MENKAKGILRGTNEAPITLHSVAESGGPCIIDMGHTLLKTFYEVVSNVGGWIG